MSVRPSLIAVLMITQQNPQKSIITYQIITRIEQYPTKLTVVCTFIKLKLLRQDNVSNFSNLLFDPCSWKRLYFMDIIVRYWYSVLTYRWACFKTLCLQIIMSLACSVCHWLKHNLRGLNKNSYTIYVTVK